MATHLRTLTTSHLVDVEVAQFCGPASLGEGAAKLCLQLTSPDGHVQLEREQVRELVSIALEWLPSLPTLAPDPLEAMVSRVLQEFATVLQGQAGGVAGISGTHWPEQPPEQLRADLQMGEISSRDLVKRIVGRMLAGWS